MAGVSVKMSRGIFTAFLMEAIIGRVRSATGLALSASRFSRSFIDAGLLCPQWTETLNLMSL